MIVHVPSLIAFLVNAAPQAPIQVQCMQQSSSDPWWKSLLPTIVQTALSLLSIGGGVGIAVWSFRRNRQTEHEQWIRDQRRAEWREILTVCDEIIRDCLPLWKQGDTIDSLIERVRMAQSRLYGLPTKFVFISDALNRSSLQLYDYVRGLDDALERMEALRFSKRAEAHIAEEYKNVHSGFQALTGKIGTSAQLSLGILKEDKHGLLINPEWGKSG